MIKGQAIKEDDGVAIELEVEGKFKDLKIETAMIVKLVIEQIIEATTFSKEIVTLEILVEIFKQLDPKLVDRIFTKFEGVYDEANRD